MKTIHLLILASCILLVGCGGPVVSTYKPRHEGSHVRAFNATNFPISVELVPNRFGDKLAPGETIYFQKEKPGKRTLKIERADHSPLKTEEVDLPDGMTTTFVVTGTETALTVGRIDGEERVIESPQGAACVTSYQVDSPIYVEIRSDKGKTVDMGTASGTGTTKFKSVDPGTYQVILDGRPSGKSEIKASVGYSVIVYKTGDGPKATIAWNSPPAMKFKKVGAQSASG